MRLPIGTKEWPVSPSALTLFETSPIAFAERYLAKSGFVQSLPMAVGQAFDEIVKSSLLGKEVPDWSSIEVPEHLEPAISGGIACMELYRDTGAWHRLTELCTMGTWHVDLDLKVEVEGVWLRIKPDFAITGVYDGLFIKDWKVSGYCSAASPVGGYIGHDACHLWRKDHWHDLVDGSGTLWKKKRDWGNQLIMYYWGMKKEATDDCVVEIEQLVWRNGKGRVCNNRSYLQGCRELWRSLERLMEYDIPQEVVDRCGNIKDMDPTIRKLLGYK